MPLHDVGYRPWTGTPRSRGAAAVIAGTGIRLAFKSRWLRRVLLFASAWQMQYFATRNPQIGLSDVPFSDKVGLSC